VLLEPTPSPFDLRWRMFGIPVRVHPTFWMFSAILGWGYESKGFSYLLLWVGCTFLSVLFHELGHVVAGRLCGQPGHIVLYSFGGLAIGNYHHVGPWRRIAISAAGPAAGLILYGLVLLFAHYALWQIDPTLNMPHLHWGVRMLLFMNLFWSLLNLIPVFPLDGGQISRDVCTLFSRRDGFRFSLGLSFLLAGVIAIYSLIVMSRTRGEPGELWYPDFDPMFMAIMFALLALQSFQMMKAVEREQRRWENDQDPW
jgi:stage IV sporulation protein FB